MKFRRVPAGCLLLLGALIIHGCAGASTPQGPTPGPTPVPTPNFPSLIAAGDISCDSATPQLPCKARETSDLLVSERALRSLVVVLPLGDLQYDSGTLAEFRKNYDATWGRLNANARPVVGNHEYVTPRAAGYFDYFIGFGVDVGARTEGWYSYDIGEWHFVALNSNCAAVGGCNLGSLQYRWLQSDLATRNKKCTVAYMHHPFQSSGQNGSTPALLPLVQLLHQNKVELVLSGHDHNYERFNPITPELVPDALLGVRLFVVGTGGRDLTGFVRTATNSAFKTNEHYGALRIIMKDEAYEWGFITTGGAVIDPGSAVCF